MRKLVGQLVFGALVATVAACTTALPPERTEAIGMPFNEEVKDRYLELADTSRAAVDWDYFHFRRKADAAVLGDLVLPDDVASRNLPAPTQAEAQQLRARLMAALERGGRVREPASAADAQANFDCWLAELETSKDASLASRCKERLVAGLTQLERALVSPDTVYLVHFDLGGTAINSAEQKAVARAAEAADLLKPAQIMVVGYADRSGSATANRRLSQARADAVAQALVERGVPAERIRTKAGGETSDQSYVDENRRVEVYFEG